MALFGGMFASKTPIWRAEVRFHDGPRASVFIWSSAEERSEVAYHTLLGFCMYYARVLFFLSFRDPAEQLTEEMDRIVGLIAAAGDGAAPDLLDGRYTLDTPDGQPVRAAYVGTLFGRGEARYSSKLEKPSDPEDTDAYDSVLLLLQHLVDTVPALERAYLALSIKGMNEYYRTVQHWHTTKSLKPAPGYGIAYARKILEQKRPA